MKSRRETCLYCNAPLVARQQINFCSSLCGNQIRRAPPRFCSCGARLNYKQKNFCSISCRWAAYQSIKKDGANDATILRMAAEGAPWAEIAKACGISKASVHRCRARLGITKAIARHKNHQPRLAKPKARKVPSVVASPPVTQREPIAIPLREVYTRAMVMNLPLSKRGDLAALNAAVRRENPTHPGYVVAAHQTSRIGFYAR